MKFALASLLVIGSAAAFAPSAVVRPAFASLAATVTGFEGKAATSKEEDSNLTYQVIMDHIDAESGEEKPKAAPKKDAKEDEE